MGMRADDDTGAAIDEMAEALLLARRLGMEIEDDRIRLLAERAGGEDRLARREGIVELGMHEDATHDVGDEHAGAVAGYEEVGAAARRAGRIVCGAQELVMPAGKTDCFLLVPHMVARRHHVGAGIDRLEKNVFRDAETAGRVLPVDDDEVQLEVADQSRQALPDGRPSGLAHHVAQKEKTHRTALRNLLEHDEAAFGENAIQGHVVRLGGY
jgi:hypothetical protein